MKLIDEYLICSDNTDFKIQYMKYKEYDISKVHIFLNKHEDHLEYYDAFF